jgi:hypothetical protein
VLLRISKKENETSCYLQRPSAATRLWLQFVDLPCGWPFLGSVLPIAIEFWRLQRVDNDSVSRNLRTATVIESALDIRSIYFRIPAGLVLPHRIDSLYSSQSAQFSPVSGLASAPASKNEEIIYDMLRGRHYAAKHVTLKSLDISSLKVFCIRS